MNDTQNMTWKVAQKSWLKGIKTAKIKDLCSTLPLLPSTAAQLEGHLLLTFCCSSLAFLLCLHLLLWSLPLSPVPSLFTPGLYSWLVVRCFCFPKSRLFLYPPSPSSAPSITHSLLLTSPCYLLSICPCIISPLAHLSLSPCAYCHHAQRPPTRLTPLFPSSFSVFRLLCFLPDPSDFVSLHYFMTWSTSSK